jgi:hypothetical protein
LLVDFFKKLPTLFAIPGLSLMFWLLADVGEAGAFGNGLSPIV